MKNFLLSIIIPCYNSGRFLERTIEMLLRQGLSECELLLVNDGSSDNTLEICTCYAAMYENIRVIDQPNRGVSVARNVGIAAAQGRYLYFLDSDDMLTDGSLDFFRKTLVQHPDVQMFAFGYESQHNGHVYKSFVYSSFDGKQMPGILFTQNFLSKKFCVHICSCIYAYEFIEQKKLLFAPNVHIGEDVLFLLQAMSQADICLYSARMTFIYCIREDSVMQGYRYKTYSEHWYHAYVLIRDTALSELVRCNNSYRISRYINFFCCYSYLKNLYRYLRADVKNAKLNELFKKDSGIRYTRTFIKENIPLWLVEKLAMFLPIGFILKIFK